MSSTPLDLTRDLTTCAVNRPADRAARSWLAQANPLTLPRVRHERLKPCPGLGLNGHQSLRVAVSGDRARSRFFTPRCPFLGRPCLRDEIRARRPTRAGNLVCVSASGLTGKSSPNAPELRNWLVSWCGEGDACCDQPWIKPGILSRRLGDIPTVNYRVHEQLLGIVR
jgi:hypothetical protein